MAVGRVHSGETVDIYVIAFCGEDFQLLNNLVESNHLTKTVSC